MSKMYETFSRLCDPRVVGRSSHPLTDIFTPGVLAVTGGVDTFDTMELFGKTHYEELKKTFR